MATVNYTLRVDETDKKTAEQVFKELGMSFATGLNIYIKAVGRQQKIPFNMDLSEKAVTMTLKDAFKSLQEESVLNGNDNISLEEIDSEISEVRKAKRVYA